MSESSGKLRKRYSDHPNDKSKPTYLIHGPWNSSDECKVLGYFGSKYAKSRLTKDWNHDTANRKKFNRQKDNNDTVNIAVYDILL